MSYPNQPYPGPDQPQPGVPGGYGGYGSPAPIPAGPVPAPYPVPGAYPAAYQPLYGADPSAPYGRDPMTGEPLSDKSKLTAGLLQLFLGGFGVGRFYLGSTSIAVAQLVLTLVGWLTAFFLVGIVILFGVGIWVLVDAIMIFAGSVTDQYGRKLRS